MSASECTTASPASAAPAGAAATATTADAVGAPWRTPLELTMLGAIWGGSFLFMRVAAADFGPLPLVEARLALGALVLLPLLWAARARCRAAAGARVGGARERTCGRLHTRDGRSDYGGSGCKCDDALA